MVNSSQVSSSRRGAKLSELLSGARQLTSKGRGWKRSSAVGTADGSLRVDQWSGCSSQAFSATYWWNNTGQPLARFPLHHSNLKLPLTDCRTVLDPLTLCPYLVNTQFKIETRAALQRAPTNSPSRGPRAEKH